MLSKLVELIQGVEPDHQDTPLTESEVRLACAALLIEVAVIDNEFDSQEMASLRDILESHFDIATQDIDDLISLAHNECSEATSMYQFTQLINQHCSEQQKFELVINMWKIAYADGDLDKYEEYVIRKVSELIYLPHGEFIRAKHLARSQR